MQMSKHIEEIRELLADMDGLFAGFHDWLWGQYDAESGGFYYANSSKQLPGSGGVPDIESTAQALNIIERFGLLSGLPEEMKRGLHASSREGRTLCRVISMMRIRLCAKMK